MCKVQTVLNFASSFLNMGKKVEICDLMVQQIDVNGVLILMLVMLLNYFVNWCDLCHTYRQLFSKSLTKNIIMKQCFLTYLAWKKESGVLNITIKVYNLGCSSRLLNFNPLLLEHNFCHPKHKFSSFPSRVWTTRWRLKWQIMFYLRSVKRFFQKNCCHWGVFFFGCKLVIIFLLPYFIFFR